jgi:hypothetical protein
MTRVVVDAGICGFKAKFEVDKLSTRSVSIVLTSECEMIKRLAEKIKALDWQDTLRSREDSAFFRAVFQSIKHIACPVPVAILKAIEAEVGLALPRDVTIHFDTTQ